MIAMMVVIMTVMLFNTKLGCQVSQENYYDDDYDGDSDYDDAVYDDDNPFQGKREPGDS